MANKGSVAFLVKFKNWKLILEPSKDVIIDGFKHVKPGSKIEFSNCKFETENPAEIKAIREFIATGKEPSLVEVDAPKEVKHDKK